MKTTNEKELAIEFADWILNKNDPGFNITTMIERSTENCSLKDGRREIPVWGHTRIGYGKTFTSKELFEQFVKERNEK
jgi:hypothetical protein